MREQINTFLDGNPTIYNYNLLDEDEEQIPMTLAQV
jgi:hypothetical protein